MMAVHRLRIPVAPRTEAATAWTGRERHPETVDEVRNDGKTAMSDPANITARSTSMSDPIAGRNRYGVVDNDNGYEGIVDTDTGQRLLDGSFMSEHAHIHNQLMHIGAAILNGVTIPPTATTIWARYHVTLGWSRDGDWANVFVMDRQPPRARRTGSMTVAWLYHGRMGDPDSGDTAALRAAMLIADGLNRMGYDWRNCTARQYERSLGLPVPEWAWDEEAST